MQILTKLFLENCSHFHGSHRRVAFVGAMATLHGHGARGIIFVLDECVQVRERHKWYKWLAEFKIQRADGNSRASTCSDMDLKVRPDRSILDTGSLIDPIL